MDMTVAITTPVKRGMTVKAEVLVVMVLQQPCQLLNAHDLQPCKHKVITATCLKTFGGNQKWEGIHGGPE